MVLGPNDALVQDRTNLNEIAMESFHAHPPVRLGHGLLSCHADPCMQLDDSSSIDEKKNGSDADVADIGETEAVTPLDANGKDRVLGECLHPLVSSKVDLTG
jgi:hypothetical protein